MKRFVIVKKICLIEGVGQNVCSALNIRLRFHDKWGSDEMT